MTALLVGLASFVLHGVVTLIWLRVRRGPSPVVRHAVSALGTHAAGVVGAAFLVGPFAYWPAAAVSGFLAVCWLFAFCAVYKSVSLRILTQLDRSPGHSLSLEAVTGDYVRPEFEARAAVLVKMGCAEEVPDGYAATPKGNDVARRIVIVRRACGVDGGGMYSETANPGRGGGGKADPLAGARGSPGLTLCLDLWVTQTGTARADELLKLLHVADLPDAGAVLRRTVVELRDEVTTLDPADVPPDGPADSLPLDAAAAAALTEKDEEPTAAAGRGASPAGPVVE